jgi:serine/threonine-protein kinase HipA
MRVAAPRLRAFEIEGAEIAVIRRFDRTHDGARIPYLSGGSLLQARRDEDRAYTELADTIRRVNPAPSEDLKELWRRLVVNLLITNVDDHLWNVGFLHVGEGKWRLAPAFDVNPFPDRARGSKTWLSEAPGPVTSLGQLLAEAPYFGIARSAAEEAAAGIAMKIAEWREIASSSDVGLSNQDLGALGPAFDHAEARAARALAR